MRRIVYSPKAYVYIQTDTGVMNVSDYVVSGQVSRKVNQVSSAEVTLQNPYLQFTKPGNPTFRPMDKITIFLQRLPGLPCQSFTGYLDETPYYQMYPGTCTLRASCTLKKLQYIWFDPGVPFMIKFLSRYGWVFKDDGSIQNTPLDATDSATDFKQQSTMSDLLFAVLKHIAGIDPGQILIEDLPDNLLDRISKIYDVLSMEDKQNQENYNIWLKAFLGTVSLGTGGMASTSSGGGGTGVGDAANGVPYADIITKWANQYNFEPALIAAIIERESNFLPGALGHDPGGTLGEGIMQLTSPEYKQWWQEYINAGDNSISANIHAGVRALRQKVDASGGDLWAGVKAYNGSGPAADEYVADIRNNRYPKYQQKFANASSSSSSSSSGSSSSSSSSTGSSTSDPSTTSSDLGTPSVGGFPSGGTQTTRFDAIVAEANRMDGLNSPYSPVRPPTDAIGYDCSSSVSDLLKKAGYQIGWETTATIVQALGSNITSGRDPDGRLTIWLRHTEPAHVWAEINGRAWSTGGSPSRAGHWYSGYYALSNPTANGFAPYHLTNLNDPASVPADADTSTTSGTGSSGSESSLGFDDALTISKTASVFTSLEFPSAVDVAESTLLTGDRSLMNDQPLLPFVEQLCKGTLRSFQSLPNGDFYAWNPDYFGAMGTAPYWEIDDIEVLEGNIQLSDDALVTHSYVIGATLPDQTIDLSRKLQTRGIVTILNAGNSDFLNLEPDAVAKENKDNKEAAKKDKKKPETLRPFLGTYTDSLNFLQKYGARPYVEDAPFIRSHAFETFYAYQNFILAWSRQFLTTFTFTFMPELYPGGIVSFKDHGINMFIDEVFHSWDYATGFTTQANLSAPSSSGTDSDKLTISRGMVRD